MINYTSSFTGEFKDGLIEIRLLPIARWISDNNIHVSYMNESPYYQSLKKNRKVIYEKYMEVMDNRKPRIKQISWEEFLNLKLMIQTQSFINSSEDNDITPIFIDPRTGQHDGHHRLAILANIYGLNGKVRNYNGIIKFFESDN